MLYVRNVWNARFYTTLWGISIQVEVLLPPATTYHGSTTSHVTDDELLHCSAYSFSTMDSPSYVSGENVFRKVGNEKSGKERERKSGGQEETYRFYNTQCLELIIS